MSEEHHNPIWTRLSARVRLQRPLCEDPFGWHRLTGRYAPAVCVHHIEGVKESPARLFDTENLLSLCQTCHDALHGQSAALTRLLSDGVPAVAVARVVGRGGRGEGGG